LVMPHKKLVKNFVAGSAGGVATILVGQPFDTVKVRLQAMPPVGAPPMYSGMLDCCKRTIARDGFKGLYKGMGASLAIASPLFALFFGGCEIGHWLQKKPGSELTFIQNANAGALAGLLTTVATVPGEHIKCILQVQTSAQGPAKYSSLYDVLKKLYNEGGIKSIYRGTGATLLRDIPSSAVYLAVYEYLKHVFTDQNNKEKLPLGPIMCAGGSAGIASWAVCMPFDVLKSRIQTAPEGAYRNGVRDAYRDLIRADGYAGLFRGFAPIILRAFPTNAACFLCFELTLEMLHLVW